MKRLLQILVSAWVLLWGAAAGAQVTLDQFSPAPTFRDGFAVSRPDHPGHLRPGAQLLLDFAKDPLVLETQVNGRPGPSETVIDKHLVAHGLISLGLFDRVLLFAHLPVNAMMRGTELSNTLRPDRPGLGNIGLGARLRLLGAEKDFFSLGVQGALNLPSSRWTRASNTFSGEGKVSAHLQVLAELRGEFFRVTGNLGTRLLDANVSGLNVDHMLTFGLGAGFFVARTSAIDVNLLAEIYGTSPFKHFGDRESSPMEFLVGPKLQHRSGLGAGLGAGAALTHGYGAPAYRIVATLAYLKPNPSDRDGDRIPDTIDACPDEPEDKDGFQDDDGCPEPDNDRDGVPDVIDHCPLEPEDRDGFQDDDGCPDPDNDRDGLLDAVDSCPNEPEDRDDFQDDDGCPDPDNDQDGFLDAVDACPLEPETMNGVDDDDGCPDKIRVDRRQGQIFVLEPVQFALNSAQILPESFDMLDEIVAVLKARPEITQLSIEGHTDAQGSDALNQILSEERAKSVLLYLTERGVHPERLSSAGYGESRPVADNRTKEGRAANRRVEFRM